MTISTPADLAGLFDKRQLSLDPVELITYEVDAGFDRGRPDGVVFPESLDDVARLMRWAAATGTPLVARGAGTGLSGGAVAEHGGIVVSFARMNRVVEFDTQGRSALVDVGVVNLALDELVKQAGLYYPPDPSSGRSAVIGGNLGENAGGPHCFKYGVTTNYVTGLEVVLANGATVRAGGRALDYPEYDLCGLLVGSEGTLAIMARAYLRLIRNPPAVKTMMVAFDTEEQAGAAVSAVIAAGLVPATLEMMDQRGMRIAEAYTPVGLPVHAGAVLIVEVDGYPDSLDSQIDEVADILTARGGFNLRIAQSEAERSQIWYGRKSFAGALARLAPNFYLIDITVPRSRLADTLTAVNAIADRHRLTMGHVFHAGDGNLHPCISFNARDADEQRRVFQASEEIVRVCVERDGSITGEHGVGIEKRAYMPMMYSGAELAAMTEIKAVFDPAGLLNPGKIFPAELPAAERQAPRLPQGEIFAPGDAAEAAAGLAALSAAGESVRIGGAAAGDRRGAARWLTTSSLTGVLAFSADDQYVTVGAGMRVAGLQEFLAAHRLRAPLVAPWPEATAGGMVAANVNSPQRRRDGGIRDVLLATTVAMADGRVIRAGRPVVKNVAGYDLPKLFAGSNGTLGLLVDVTLRLLPQPRLRRTLALPAQTPEQGLAWAAATAPVWLATSSVVLCQSAAVAGIERAPFTLLWTLEGVAEDVIAETAALDAALRSARAPSLVEVAQPAAAALWANFVARRSQNSLLLRVGVPAGQLQDYWRQIAGGAEARGIWCFDPGNSLAYATHGAGNDPAAAAAWVERMRAPALTLGGYAVVMQTPPGLSTQIDRWGYRPDALALMQALKAQWDPAGILNPGDSVAG